MLSVSDLLRRDISVLLEGESILLEASDYEMMFADIKPMLEPMHAQMLAHATREAQRILRRKDRIIWFLRQWRIGFLRRVVSDARGGDAEYGDQQIAIFESIKARLCFEYAARSKQTVKNVNFESYNLFRDADDYLQKFEHALGMGIYAIERVKFAYQPLWALLKKFGAEEVEWGKTGGGGRGGVLKDPRDKVILDFGNGTAWYDLNRASCAREGKVMGHCGNEPRAKTDDTILSLRVKEAGGGDAEIVKPYLSFILKSNGFLGEMKGRFNKSPRNAFNAGTAPSDFSAEIAALLRLPIIKGVSGGGYEAHQNFKLNDLPEEMRESLYQEKPTIAPLSWLLESQGETAEVAAHFQATFESAEGNFHPVYQPAQNAFLLETYVSLVDSVELVRNQSNLREAARAVNGVEPYHQDFDHDHGSLDIKLLAALRKADVMLYQRVAASAPEGMEEGSPPEPAKLHATLANSPSGWIIRRALLAGRKSALVDAAENYLYDWISAAKPAMNQSGQVFDASLVPLGRYRGAETPVNLLAPFETLARISGMDLMDKNLRQLIRFQDGPVFVSAPEDIDWDTALESLMEMLRSA